MPRKKKQQQTVKAEDESKRTRKRRRQTEPLTASTPASPHPAPSQPSSALSASSSAASCSSSSHSAHLVAFPLPPFLSALTPVRLLFHSFLTDEDAARLLRVSRTTATSLLASYTFHQHVFEPISVDEMRRLKALYEAYDMRPTRMCQHRDFAEKSRLVAGGESPFPSSLTSLMLGAQYQPVDSIHPRSPFGSDAHKVHAVQCPWTNSSESEDVRCRRLR